MATSIKTQGQNLTLYQGSTFEKTFVTKNANSQNVSISTGSCFSQMRKNYTTTNTTLILTFTTSISGSNVTISASATDTANIPSGLYVYDVEYLQSDGITKERIVDGMITVIPEATKI